MIGYARVSTQEQETHAQIDALKAAKCAVIYEEKKSGGSLSRPILFQMLSKLRPGDTVLVYKLDRIARSLRDLLEIIDRIEKAGAEFKSLTEVIDTATPAGRMILQILGAFAEFERQMIQERTRIGMRAAMARGAKPGRPHGMSPENEAECVERFLAGKVTKTELAKEYGVHISSIKRAIARYREAMQPGLFN